MHSSILQSRVIMFLYIPTVTFPQDKTFPNNNHQFSGHDHFDSSHAGAQIVCV